MDKEYQSIRSIANALRAKRISVPELTRSFFQKISKLDERIGSYITLCEEQAMEHSQAVQKKFDADGDLSLLAGIPYGLKDNICTKDILTTCASDMLSDFVPPYDATVVQKLNESDAVLLGKLNMDEFGMGSTTESSACKITRNPLNEKKVPGGSSGGPAACIAASLAAFTLGSDTGGSIRQPASFCGVVGLKPTYGAVSRYGLIAFASSLDQIGPITLGVEDAALVMQAIAGYDASDATCADRPIPNYEEEMKRVTGKGLKIGLPKEYFSDGVHPKVAQAVKTMAKTLESKGAVVEEISLPLTDYAIAAYYIMTSAEAGSNLARFDGINFGKRTDSYENLSDIYKNTRSERFGFEVKRRIMLGTYALSSGYYDAYYKKALQVRTMIMQSFEDVFNTYDLILGPVAPTTAYDIGEKTHDPLEMYMGDIFTVSANIAGLPAIAIPCGKDDENMPIGAQLIAKPFAESLLLGVGHLYEQTKNAKSDGEVVAR